MCSHTVPGFVAYQALQSPSLVTLAFADKLPDHLLGHCEVGLSLLQATVGFMGADLGPHSVGEVILNAGEVDGRVYRASHVELEKLALIISPQPHKGGGWVDADIEKDDNGVAHDRHSLHPGVNARRLGLSEFPAAEVPCSSGLRRRERRLASIS